MSEEPRRSGRSTKGHHSSTKASSSPAPTQQKVAKPAKTKSKKAVKAAPEDEADSEEGDIRCICGDTNPKTNLEFIGCEACLCWQHNVCMGEPESEDGKLPEHYFCEECRPEEHRETVAALNEGKKIWEVRQQLFKQWKKMSSSRKRSKAKSGEELRPTYVKKDENVEVGEADANGGHETGSKRKRPSVIPDDEDAEAHASAPARQRRKPSVLDDPETAVVEIDQLPADRRKIAQALSAIISADLTERVKAGYRIPDGHTASSLGEHYATLIEYALYQNHGGPAEEKYKAQFRALNANLKRNKVLIERLLEDSLTADELALMESKDMASEEQQLERKRMKEELDRQAVAIQEEGPRFKQDHKGVEKIEDDRVGSSEFAANSQPVRERASIADESADGPSGSDGNATTTQREAPSSTLGRRSSSQQNFDMNNIWQKTTGSAQSPTSSNGPRLLQMPPRRRSSMQMSAQQNTAGVATEDPDVDRLLQEDDDDSYDPSDLPESVVWRGKLVHAGEGEPVVNARFVAGRDIAATTAPWRHILPAKLTVDGRLAVAKAEEYLCGLQWSHTSDVSVLALRPYDDKEAFDRVFDYFASRQRYAVINRDKPALVKDLYVIPVDKGGQLPEHVTLLEHSELKAPVEERMMLATFVIARAQQQSQVSPAAGTNGGQTSGTPAQQQPHLPQHIRAGAPGPAGSPLNQSNPSFSPSALTHPGQQPIAGYGAPVPPQTQPPFSGNGFPPNPYDQNPSQALLPAFGGPIGGVPAQYPPMVVEILGPRFLDASAQAVLAAQPNLEEAKVRHLRAILDEDMDARTNVEALARRLGAIGS